MIGMILAALALQTAPATYESVNPTIPYTRCMRSGLSARLPADAEIESAKRLALFEQTLAECAAVRASALANVDAWLAGLVGSNGERPDPRFNGTVMMGIWDKTFREFALDPKFRWQDGPAGKPGQ